MPSTVNGDPHIDAVEYLRISLLPSGDFDGDGSYGCDDVDALVAAIVAGNDPFEFDLDGDGTVDAADLTAWLAEAGQAELMSGNPYLTADADLNGVVNGHDFIVWNNHKFTTGSGWCGGDFNADGQTDGQDFVLWNNHKFTSSDALRGVPESFAGWPAWLVLGLLSRRLQRGPLSRRGRHCLGFQHFA